MAITVYSKSAVSDEDLIKLLPKKEQLVWLRLVIDKKTQTQIAKEDNCTKSNISKKVKSIMDKLEILRKLPIVDIDFELKNIFSKRDRLIAQSYLSNLSVTETAEECGVKLNTAKRIINNLTGSLVPIKVRKYVKIMQDNKSIFAR